MNLEVNSEEMILVKENVINNSSDLEKEVNLWLQKLNDLKEIWQGEDSDIFYEKATSYVKSIQLISNSMNTIGTFIDKASHTYKEKDEEMRDVLEREVKENEENINNGFQWLPR